MADTANKLDELSVFFPLYNEEENVEQLVYSALETLPKLAEEFEILLINDGSKDNTKEVAERLAEKNKRVIVINQRNKGYGGAVKRGFKEAKYKWVFFSDGDLQFNLEDLYPFIKYTNNYDLVIGYRRHRAEGFRRKLLADMLKLWNYTFLGFPRYIRDIDCAFKLIKKDVITECSPLVSDGAMLTTELLLKAHRKGFSIKQLGVRHYKRKHGNPTGSNLLVILRAVRDTFILQKNLLLGR